MLPKTLKKGESRSASALTDQALIRSPPAVVPRPLKDLDSVQTLSILVHG